MNSKEHSMMSAWKRMRELAVKYDVPIFTATQKRIEAEKSKLGQNDYIVIDGMWLLSVTEP